MRKTILVSLILGSVLLANGEKVDFEKEYIQSVIPKSKIAKYEKAEIDGLYKVFFDNGQMFYVDPFKKLLIFGEIWNNSGHSFTQKDAAKWQDELDERLSVNLKAEILTKHAKKIIYGKGSSKYQFVIFTDPECPFCHTAEKFFENKDVDLFVMYKPLEMHKNAKEYALKALSSKDFTSAYKGIKETIIPDVVITGDAKKQLKEMENVANELNIQGTPKIYVIDKESKKVVGTIQGANIPKLEGYFK